MTELLITVGIIGMVAGISGLWLASQIPKFRLQGATRHVMSDLMATRMRAVSQGNKFRITFLDPRQYTILDDDNNNGKADPGEHVETRDIQSEYRDVTLSSTNNPIFHPRGTASNLATVTIQNAAGSKALTVSMTGRVKLKPLAE